jgi:hypothetical protein
MRLVALLLAASLSVSVARPSVASPLTPDRPGAPSSSEPLVTTPPPPPGSRPAQSAPRPELVAQEEFAAGQRLFDQKRFAEALARFRKAYELSASPNAHLMVARSLLGAGRTPEAYEEMAATMHEATARSEAEPKYIPARDAAAAELALLERRVGKVIVVLVEPGEGVSVELNGAPLSPQRVGVPVAVEPGSVAVAAERAGKPIVRREVKVRGGETKTVAISFVETAPVPDLEPVARVEAVAQKPVVAPPRGSGLLRALGYGATGVGVAGTVVFGVAGSMAESKYATLERECGGRRCRDPGQVPVIEMGKALDRVANVGLAVGIAGLVGGTAMILVGAPANPRRASASIDVSPLGVRVVGSF